MNASDIPSIGRERNPAERSLANAVERPEAAEYHGSALYWSKGHDDWEDLSQPEKDVWIGAALDMMREHAETYVPPDRPPPGDDGEPMPVESAS